LEPLNLPIELLILIDLALVIIFAKLFEEMLVRLNQPPILGDLLAGITLGPTFLGIIRVTHNVEVVGWLGIVILIFLAGLETDIEAARKYGRKSFLVAAGGVAATFTLAFIIALLFNYPILTALFIATILSPTSVSVTSSTLLQLGVLKRREGEIIMGAAFADDVIAMLLFAVVSSIVYHGELRVEVSARIVLGLIFIFSAFLLLYKFSEKIFNQLILASRLVDAPIAHLTIIGIVMGVLSSYFGFSPLVGAYLAGLAMSKVVKRTTISFFEILAQIISPFFFAYAGILLDPWGILSRINMGEVVLIVISIVSAGIIGKIIGCGGIAKLAGLDRKSSLTIGIGMIPRAGVDLVIAVVGITTGVLTMELYFSALILIYVSSLSTPILLTYLFHKNPSTI
jgi:Kef-type K+ transport system membrane component KefB